jgi:hypothetical protein
MKRLEANHAAIIIDTESKKVINSDAIFRPEQDNIYDIGDSEHRWKNIYSTNGSILTSDKNKKTNIQPLNSKYSQLFDKLRPASYRFNDGTRIHTGLVAQDVKQAMEEVGIDSQEFAAYCSWKKEDGTEGCGLRYEEFIALCIAEI